EQRPKENPEPSPLVPAIGQRFFIQEGLRVLLHGAKHPCGGRSGKRLPEVDSGCSLTSSVGRYRRNLEREGERERYASHAAIASSKQGIVPKPEAQTKDDASAERRRNFPRLARQA